MVTWDERLAARKKWQAVRGKYYQICRLIFLGLPVAYPGERAEGYIGFGWVGAMMVDLIEGSNLFWGRTTDNKLELWRWTGDRGNGRIVVNSRAGSDQMVSSWTSECVSPATREEVEALHKIEFELHDFVGTDWCSLCRVWFDEHTQGQSKVESSMLWASKNYPPEHPFWK